MPRLLLLRLAAIFFVAVASTSATTLTLTLPSQVAEGATPTNNATVVLDEAPSSALTISLSADTPDELVFPPSVTVPAGQTQVVFTVRAVNDTKIDGNILVTVTASGSGIDPATAQTTTIDNETRTLSLTLPAIVQEGGSANGTVSIPGTLTTPLTVNLTSANESQATVPTTATIPTGSTSTAFSIAALDNTLRDGSRAVTISASADTFTGASKSITIRDNDVASYGFSINTDIVNLSGPITVSALDIEGNAISGFSGDASLGVVQPDGTVQPVTPAIVTLAGTNGWTGNVTLPADVALPVRLRATDSNGYTGDSMAFDVMRVIPLMAADIVWDASRRRIYASVPAAAGGTHANQVVAIDPTSLEISGSVTVGQDPRKLALTSGAEALYVALDANGTVAKIDPTSMSVTYTFVVGSDPDWGTLYAEDMCAVAGQPDLVVVSRHSKKASGIITVVAYDNGVMRPNKVYVTNRIEASADPAIFFGYQNWSSGFTFRQLRLDANGMTLLSETGYLIDGFYTDIRSDGNTVFSNTGVEVDGATLQRLGTFPVVNPNAVCPDLVSDRVYFADVQSSSFQGGISAFEPTTFALARRLTIPMPIWPGSYIRWGANGLAMGRADSDSITLINSNRLVPNYPPADLAVTIQATPDPTFVDTQFNYTVQVSNQGSNVAHDTFVTATLSDSQTLQGVNASTGSSIASGSTITLPVGDLGVGASVTLTITASPESAGRLYCKTVASSSSIDPDFTNNVAIKFVSAGFQAGPDTVNMLRLGANNLIYDTTRNLLWVTVRTASAPYPPPLNIFPDNSLVAINPIDGLTSDPILLNESTVERSIAISPNGRYLYIGLYNSAEVCRVDLSSTPPTTTRIPLGKNPSGERMCAQDFEVLDGDGTSFLMTGTFDHAAVVFDGSVPRPNRTAKYSVSRIERTATPNLFVGYNNDAQWPAITGDLTKLSVTASGVSIIQSDSNIIRSYYAELRGKGDLLLSSSGALVDSGAFALKANLGLSGTPCLDVENGRAYLLNGAVLYGFDTLTGGQTGTFALPVSGSPCARWGLDGFAVAGYDGRVYIARWSATIPFDKDQNGDLISDQWAATYFGTLNVDSSADPDGDGIPNALEYLFGTSPIQSNANPMQVSTTTDNGETIIHIIFPRRVGLAPEAYGFETSAGLQQWDAAQGVTETVLSTQTVDGVQVDTVDAAIPSPAPDHGFARLKWLGP